MDVESRVTHQNFGPGTVTEMVFTAGGNLPAARVAFDDGSERVLLLSVLTLSKTPGSAPSPAKKKNRRRKTTSSRMEPISDELLVPTRRYADHRE